jgi:hypothetical protein
MEQAREDEKNQGRKIPDEQACSLKYRKFKRKMHAFSEKQAWGVKSTNREQWFRDEKF